MRANEHKSESIKTAITESNRGWVVCAYNNHFLLLLRCLHFQSTLYNNIVPIIYFVFIWNFIIFPLKFADKKNQKNNIFFLQFKYTNISLFCCCYFSGELHVFAFIVVVIVWGGLQNFKSPGTRYSFIQLFYAVRNEWK